MRRQESFPWIIVMGGAVLYWTIALGIGIPSLYRMLGEPGPARRVTTTETRCVQAQTIDGTPVVFGDCINVRFLLDTPDLYGRRAFDQYDTLPSKLPEPMIDDSDLGSSEPTGELPTRESPTGESINGEQAELQKEQQNAAPDFVEAVPAFQPSASDRIGRTSF
jgi:hypothetical protein